MFEGHLSTRYEVLMSVDPKLGRPRRRWSQKLNSRLKGFRVSRLRKLNWKAYSVVIWSKKIARIYAELVNRILNIQGKDLEKESDVFKFRFLLFFRTWTIEPGV
ncbi:hypothetical protein ACET3Z_030821 [Daucus carota]